MSFKSSYSQHFVTSLGAAEAFFDVSLPDYGSNGLLLAVVLTIATLFWFVLVPILVSGRTSGKSSITLTQRIYYCCGTWCLVLGSLSVWNHSARTVYEASILTPQECDQLLKAAAAVAFRNYETAMVQSEPDDSGFLEEPYGWHKTRKYVSASPN